MQKSINPRRHVFISYSHQDETVVALLRSSFEAQNTLVWIDNKNLKPGTYDWEMSVRKGIMQALAVIYVASPNAIISTYVKDELNIARDTQIPVYPFWIAGKQWSEVAPIGWGMTQYIDARNTLFHSGLVRLISIFESKANSFVTTSQESGPKTSPLSVSKMRRRVSKIVTIAFQGKSLWLAMNTLFSVLL